MECRFALGGFQGEIRAVRHVCTEAGVGNPQIGLTPLASAFFSDADEFSLPGPVPIDEVPSARLVVVINDPYVEPRAVRSAETRIEAEPQRAAGAGADRPVPRTGAGGD